MFPALRDDFLYEPIEQNGFGMQKTIFKGRDRTNGELVVMKKVSIIMGVQGVPGSILREIGVLKTLGLRQHPNIIRLLDVVQGPQLINGNTLSIFMIFEHTEQDLDTFIANCPPEGLPSGTIKSLMKQLLSGVEFLQYNSVIHRDLKPTNILMTNDFRIKISNFGFSRIYNAKSTVSSIVETLMYHSPEVILNMSYSAAMDMWACGCIMAEMYLLAPLFPGQSEIRQLNKIFRVIGLPSEEDWPADSTLERYAFETYLPISFRTLIPQLCSNGEDLLQKFLEFKISKRVTASDALKHPYFDGTDE